MLIAKSFLVCLFIAAPFISLHENKLGTEGDPPIVEKGYSGKRHFGDLTTHYSIGPTGKNVQCTLYVSSVLAGIEALNSSNPTYDFDVEVGLGSAYGTLKLNLVDSPLISKISGDFIYSVSANNDSFTFKGDLVGWYSSK